MYTSSELKGMLFIDIETASQYETLKDLKKDKESLYDLWIAKATQIKSFESDKADLTDQEMFKRTSSLHPEFGKIITISIGQIKFDEIGMPVKTNIKSFYGDDEVALLNEFNQTMQAVFNQNSSVKLIGHNIKRFDMPWIIKRCLINGITPIHQFHLQKQKPWENCLLDTLEIWKFGGYSGASLDLICNIFNIPSPKDAMKNTDVSEHYWGGRLEDIKNYCEGDVLATMNVMLKMSNMPIL